MSKLESALTELSRSDIVLALSHLFCVHLRNPLRYKKILFHLKALLKMIKGTKNIFFVAQRVPMISDKNDRIINN